MKVVHAPTEIAGQMGLLCYGLKKFGIHATGFNWFNSYIGYSDHITNTDGYELMRILDTLLEDRDLFHFHNWNSFFISGDDLPFINQLGKKMVMQHWGNDVRTIKAVKQLNPYQLPPSYLSDEEIHRRLTHTSKYISTAIVQDYEVYPYVADYYEHVHVLPLACDTNKHIPIYPSITETTPTILHAPTNREFKGTEYVEKTILDLKDKYSFHYKTIENLSHKEALKVYSSGDIIIDQILCGSHGSLSVEAMALVKVVVAFIRDDVREKMPVDLPIVIANPENLYDVSQNLIQNPELRHEIGIASRKYVEKHHSIDSVTKQLISIYKSVLEGE